MDKRFLTFFVLTNDTSRARQFKIPFKTLKMAGVASALCAFVFAFVIFDYARIRVTGLDAIYGSEQRAALGTLSAKIKDLEGQLAKLNMFDQKLRIIANIERDPKKAGNPEQVRGIGGDSVDEGAAAAKPGTRMNEFVDKMRSDLLNMEYRAKDQEASFEELKDYLTRRSVMLASTPSIWPAKGWVTSTYGSRISPFTGNPQLHAGLDIANRAGTPVVAPADGVVVEAGMDSNLGRMVVISHGFGLKTTFGHLSETSVRAGQRVKRGATIGAMGNTGRSTGPHLHYAVSVNGINVNPEKYIID